MECAGFAIDALWLAPVDREQAQAMQELAARAIRLFAQVEFKFDNFCRRLEPQLALLDFQVTLQGNCGRLRAPVPNGRQSLAYRESVPSASRYRGRAPSGSPRAAPLNQALADRAWQPELRSAERLR